MTTLGDTLYENAVPTAAKLPAPTDQNVPHVYTSTPVGGVGQAPAWSLPGTAVDTRSTTTEVINAADRSSLVQFTNGSATAATLIQSGTSFATNNFSFGIMVSGAGTVTLTATTSTFTCVPASYCSGSVLTLGTGTGAFVYSNNTNYFAMVIH
jgi:hypothetical protein